MWSDRLTIWLLLRPQSNRPVDESACICKSCGDNVKKGISDSQYKPRWVKLTSKPTTTCDVIGYHSQSSRSLKRTDLATLTKNGLNFKSNTHSSLVVCASHAMQTYRILNPIPCKGCGIKPSTGKTSHERYPPNSTVVNAYYQQNTEFAETFSESDKICFSCYCFHLQIVNQAQLKSEDYALKLLIKEIKESTSDSNLEAAAAKAFLLAAEMLLNQRAMLLPKLHSLFVLWLKDMPQSLATAVITVPAFLPPDGSLLGWQNSYHLTFPFVAK